MIKNKSSKDNIDIHNVEIEEKPSIKVTVQLTVEITLQGKKIEEVETGFRKAFKEAACKSIGKYLEQRENVIIFEQSSPGEREIRKIFHNRTLKLSYGDVKFACRQVKKEGKYCIPLLNELGLPHKKRVVLSSYSSAFSNCLWTSFRKAQGGVKNTLSLGWIHHEFQHTAQEMRKAELKSLEYLNDVGYDAPAPPSNVVRVMDDGIFIRERVLPGRGKGQKQDKRHHMMVQITRCDFGIVGNGKKYWSYPPAVFASIEPAKNHIAHSKTYLNVHTGLSRCGAAIHISDGGANGKRHCKEYNPNAVWQLDWWHLSKHVKVLWKIDKKWRNLIWELLNVERLDEALKSLSDRLKILNGGDFEKTPENCKFLSNLSGKGKDWLEKRSKEVKDLITYLSNNRDGIYGVKKLVKIIPGEHLPFGSGPMERLCGILVAHRMKGNGRAWRRESGDNMVWRIKQEFQSFPKTPILEQALKEAQWWEALQEKPVRHISESSSKNRRNCGGSARCSFPIVKRGQRSCPLYKTFKNIQSRQTCNLVSVNAKGGGVRGK